MSRALRLPIILLSACAACFVLPLATIPLALGHAETLAHGRRLCIEVPRDPERWGYTPAQSALDLHAGQMQARRDQNGLFPIFHAVLYIENPDASWGQPAFERYNWSYAMLRFEPIEGQGHAALRDVPRCHPQSDYAQLLLTGTAR